MRDLERGKSILVSEKLLSNIVNSHDWQIMISEAKAWNLES
jgi:hypothetical protein